jgi:superfamily II DNA or RNA helicase
MESPTFAKVVEISDAELTKLQKLLTYIDKSVDFQIKNIKKSRWMIGKFGEQRVAEMIEELNAQRKKCLLVEDKNGLHFLSGLLPMVMREIPSVDVVRNFELPEFRLIPWSKTPPFEMAPHQRLAVERMIANPHCHIESATGSGKSFVVMNLCKQTGLPTIISTPSASIARQMYDECAMLFGKNKVGLIGDGKRELGKHILVAVGKSLAMVEDPEEIEQFKKYQVFISDESHFMAADTFSKYAEGLLSHCPYRWFVSATPERNDGRDLYLEGLIGPQVMSYPIQQAIADGFLAKLNFMVFDVESHAGYSGDNNIKLNQEHFYKNNKIIHMIADLVNHAVGVEGIPTLVLVDEYAQEEYLRPHLKVNYEFASGQADTSKIVKEFNSGAIKCIIGTAAVSVGTNIKPVRLTINFQGNKAGTKIKQAVIGRSTRLDSRTGKTECNIVDFRVTNIPQLKRHADIRIGYYDEISPVTFVRV